MILITLLSRLARHLRLILPKLVRLISIFVFISVVTGCALPKLDQSNPSYALSADEAHQTLLGETLQPQALAHPNLSGIRALSNPHDAFAARALLTQVAEKTLDIQYYIWRKDITGMLLLEALHEAADRGVRVRLLLDDNGTQKLDQELSALANHPLIEVRLFNPFMVRTPKWLGFVSDFPRANRRMHNKAFIADNQVAIVGGRNIGDEYFGADARLLFADLDVVAVGEVVPHVSADFDRYWSSQSAFPIESIVPSVKQDLDHLSEAASNLEANPAAETYFNAISESDLIQELVEGALEFDWSPTSMLSDDPAKGLGLAKPDSLIGQQLEQIIGQPNQQVTLISPYFVPTKTGTQVFIDLVKRGIQVRILTNSLAATDVVAVHAGYAKQRRNLIAGGVELFEMRRGQQSKTHLKKLGPFASSATSLHAKTFAVDSQRVFVGSFNFDPRSTHLNTELGFVIDSPDLAKTIEQSFKQDIPTHAYQVKLNDQNQLIWIEYQTDQAPIIHQREPSASVWRRMRSKLWSVLPIEWLL